MTKTLAGLLLIAGVAIVAITTKPTDDQCMEEVSARYDSGISAALHASKIMYQVQDHIFYKTITNRFTGRDVAYAAFSTVFY